MLLIIDCAWGSFIPQASTRIFAARSRQCLASFMPWRVTVCAPLLPYRREHNFVAQPPTPGFYWVRFLPVIRAACSLTMLGASQQSLTWLCCEQKPRCSHSIESVRFSDIASQKNAALCGIPPRGSPRIIEGAYAASRCSISRACSNISEARSVRKAAKSGRPSHRERVAKSNNRLARSRIFLASSILVTNTFFDAMTKNPSCAGRVPPNLGIWDFFHTNGAGTAALTRYEPPKGD